MAQPLLELEPVAGSLPDWYAMLQIAPDASYSDIDQAYRRQIELYDPEHARLLGQEFVAVARERRATLDKAFAVLHDPARRFAYDRQRGLVGDAATDRRGVSNRDVVATVVGVFVALLTLAVLWPATSRTSQSRTEPAVAEVNFPAPPFVLRTLDGGHFDLATQRGKVVLVNFWATWCQPCREETPALQEAYRKLEREGLVIVGVDLYNQERAQGHGEQAVREFTSQYGVTYPIALDETGDVARDYRIAPIPVSYFVDQAGNARYIRIGRLTTEGVEDVFRRLQPATVHER